jgi:adenosylcobyric acid synthase
MVAGTASEAGKSAVVAGLCRWLARQGVSVAPFKAQNMALNSGVTGDGAEIGRAQLMQAAAAGVEPEAAMNPVLLKPSAGGATQVVVMGHPAGSEDARSYQRRREGLAEVVHEALADLRSRYDVVICEGAGSPAEVNLREHDLANMGLARAAGLPVVVVGDIDRGGVLASFYGTLALLEPADQALVTGFMVNKFRGDPQVLAPGLDQLRRLTGRSCYGVLPWTDGLHGDGEDSLSLPTGGERFPGSPDDAPSEGTSSEDAWSDDASADNASLVESGNVPGARRPRAAGTGEALEVAVVRLAHASNTTDAEALACEPGATVRLSDHPGELARADLVVIPGSKATVADLAALRRAGIDSVLAQRAACGKPVFGICGGYQMLGTGITDEVESGGGRVDGLGLLPVETVFAEAKHLARPSGRSRVFGDAAVNGYEIRHGRVTVDGGAPLMERDDGQPEGCLLGAVAGTSWHGVAECDAFRRGLLSWVAESAGREFAPGWRSHASLRQARLDALGELVAEYAETSALAKLITDGPDPQLPTVAHSQLPDDRGPDIGEPSQGAAAVVT